MGGWSLRRPVPPEVEGVGGCRMVCIPPPPDGWDDEPIKPAVLGGCGTLEGLPLVSYVAPKRTLDMLGTPPPPVACWNACDCGVDCIWCSRSLLAGTGGALRITGSMPSSIALLELCTGGLIDSDEGAPLREFEADRAALRPEKEPVDGSDWGGAFDELAVSFKREAA